MTTSPVRWKSQTQVNTTSASDQLEARITDLQDGGYVVVWIDYSRTYNPAGSSIIGQRYDAAGSKVGGETKISLFTSGDQSQAAITTLANGNIAVAFNDDFNNNDDTYVRIFNPALGLVRTDSIDIGTNQTDGPSLTAFADGSYEVAYMVENSLNDTDIVGRHVSAGGVVGAQFVIDLHTVAFPQLATLSNGNFVVAYQDKFGPTNDDVKFGIYMPDGTPVAGSTAAPGGNGPGLEFVPDVAALAGGGFVVVWTDPDLGSDDVRASILDNFGAPVASNILVNTTTAGDQEEPNVVGLPDGGFVVTWEDVGAALERAQRFDALGHTIGTEVTIKNGLSVYGLEAAVLTDGRLAYALSDFSVSNSDYNIATSIWTTGVAPRDFNADVTSDLLLQNGATLGTWFLQNGALAGGANTGMLPAGWGVVATGDFNGNESNDLLLQSGSTLGVWFIQNGVVSGGANTGVLPAGWSVVGTGDFNADGFSDLLLQSGATLGVWFLQNGAVTGGATSGVLPGGWSVIKTGDFNGDGTTDLLLRNGSTLGVWQIHNGVVTSGANTGVLPAGWDVVDTGHFNADATDDLLLQNGATLGTWFIQNGMVSGGANTGVLPGGWSVAGTGDYNHDGTTDILVRSGAALGDWLVHDGVGTTGVGIGVLPAGWLIAT